VFTASLPIFISTILIPHSSSSSRRIKISSGIAMRSTPLSAHRSQHEHPQIPVCRILVPLFTTLVPRVQPPQQHNIEVAADSQRACEPFTTCGAQKCDLL